MKRHATVAAIRVVLGVTSAEVDPWLYTAACDWAPKIGPHFFESEARGLLAGRQVPMPTCGGCGVIVDQAMELRAADEQAAALAADSDATVLQQPPPLK